MCEAEETLQKLRHEFDVMLGNSVVDIGRIRQLLNTSHERHQ